MGQCSLTQAGHVSFPDQGQFDDALGQHLAHRIGIEMFAIKRVQGLQGALEGGRQDTDGVWLQRLIEFEGLMVCHVWRSPRGHGGTAPHFLFGMGLRDRRARQYPGIMTILRWL
jgi:hypothetical protein